MFYYAVTQTTLWWFSHTVVLFWGIKFPFHVKSFEGKGRMKYIHIAVVLIALILPCAPVIGTFDTLGHPVAPPLTACVSNVNFYALVLPLGFVGACGISLQILMFKDIAKVRSQ